jgi:hypothetical protein
MLAVGSAMGISEQAAIKRVSRAVQRLRSILASRGIEIAGDAMAGMLGIGLVQKAPAHLIAAASEMGSKATAAHGGLANLLAKSASRGMLRSKLSIVTAKFVLAAACVGTAATVAVEKTRPPATKPPVILADVAAPAAQPEAEYQACQQVLQSVVDAYDNEDPSAADAQLYFGPDADPQLVHLGPPLLDGDVAAYRVQKDAIAKFETHAMGVNYYESTVAVTLDELLGRIGPSDFSLNGDTLVINPPAPFPSHLGAWPKAPMYFHKVGADWKLDAGRTFKLVFEIRRRIPIPGETREQTAAAYIKDFTNAYNVVADDIEQNKITSAAEVQKRLDGAVIGFSMRYSQFSILLRPKQTSTPANHL